MQDGNSSSSLEINEPSQRMMLFSNDHIQNSGNNDLSELDYSKEEDSLSFQIEEEAKGQKRQESVEVPAKRKRKQIFQRFKKPPTNQMESQNSLTFTNEEDIMQTFDEIFKISPQEDRRIENKPAIFSKNKKKIFEQSPQKLQSVRQSPNKFVKTPFQFTPQTKRQLENEGQMANLSNNRISIIQNRQTVEISVQAADLAQILESQIFQPQRQVRERKEEKVAEKDVELEKKMQNNIEKDRQINIQRNRERNVEKQIEKDIDKGIEKKPQEISIQKQIERNNEKIEKQKQQERKEEVIDQQSKNSPYQKIDMSASMASSIMMKQSRFTALESPRNMMGNFTKKSQTGGGFFAKQLPEVAKVNIERMILESSQEVRVPAFIRKLRMLNAVYPNFSHPSVNLDLENTKLQKIVHEFHKNLNFLEAILKNIKLMEKKKKEVQQIFTSEMTVQNFTQLNWQQELKVEGIEEIKPRTNFVERAWEDQKVEKALENYRKIVDYYRGLKLNFKDERAVKKYSDIRKKFWDVQRNIRMISEDMYTKIQSLHFPYFYYEYLSSLKDEKLLFSQGQIHKKRILLKKVKILRIRNEELSRSVVGQALISKLQRELKYSCSL